MSGSAFHDAGSLEKIALPLLRGWGYNYYLQQSPLRIDDQLVRGKIGGLLGTARKGIETAEREYRREFLPPPSREKPRHDAQAVAGAQTLERIASAIRALQSQIGAQPALESDPKIKRHLQDSASLQQLTELDQKLTGQAELLRSLIDQKSGPWLIENAMIPAYNENYKTDRNNSFSSPPRGHLLCKT